MSETYIKDEGIVKEVLDFWIKDSGEWKQVQNAWLKDSGEWKLVFAQDTLSVEYLIVAGGGGGSSNNSGYDPAGGGGGGGGFRTNVPGSISGRNSDPEAGLKLEVGVAHTITVGGGGAAGG
jgi:hypothetical protein